MFRPELEEILTDRIQIQHLTNPRWEIKTFLAPRDHALDESGGTAHMIRLWFTRPDTFTGVIEEGDGGWQLVPATADEETVVKIALRCVLSLAEHEARENFLYKGKRAFGPHTPLRGLLGVAL